MLVIDELHNILAGSPARQREFLALLRFLGNELRIPIVGVGTKEAYMAIPQRRSAGKSFLGPSSYRGGRRIRKRRPSSPAS